MCSNRKIRELGKLYERPALPDATVTMPAPGVTVDELNRGRAEVLNRMPTLIQDRPFPMPGLTMQTHWNLIRHRIEREHEANQG